MKTEPFLIALRPTGCEIFVDDVRDLARIDAPSANALLLRWRLNPEIRPITLPLPRGTTQKGAFEAFDALKSTEKWLLYEKAEPKSKTSS